MTMSVPDGTRAAHGDLRIEADPTLRAYQAAGPDRVAGLVERQALADDVQDAPGDRREVLRWGSRGSGFR